MAAEIALPDGRQAVYGPLFGNVLMVAGCGLITLSDAFTKMVVATLRVAELILIRSAMALAFMGFAVPLLGGRLRLRPGGFGTSRSTPASCGRWVSDMSCWGMCGMRRRLWAPA